MYEMSKIPLSDMFSGDLLDLLDARGHGYLIKVKMRNLT